MVSQTDLLKEISKFFFAPITLSLKKVINLVDRTFLFSNSEYDTKNLTLIIEILLQNDCLLNFIFNTINNRVKSVLRRETVSYNNSKDKDESTLTHSWFTVPFIPSLTEKFNKFNRDDIKVSFYSSNKLKKYIKVHKDRRSHLSKNNVVYKINCNDCDVIYVG